MRERVEHGIFGYSNKTDGYYDAVCAWFARRQDWAIERDWVVTTPGVVPTLNVVVRGFTAPGDRVIVQRPVYYPFFRVAKNHGAEIVSNGLISENGTHRIDLQDVYSQTAGPRATLRLLSAPPNPDRKSLG